MELISVIPLISLISYILLQSIHMVYSLGFWRYRDYRSGEYVTPNDLASIIIPIKEEPIYILQRTLNELSNLEWPSSMLEIIVVSDDKDPKVREDISRAIDNVRSLHNLNIKAIFRNDPVGGRAGAINKGIESSRGKIIFIIDVDTIPSPRSLIEAYRYIKIDKCGCVVLRWDGYYEIGTRLASAMSTIMKYIVSILYRGRSGLGFKVIPLGSGTIYDRGVFDIVGMWDYDVVQDDYWMGIKMIGSGLKTCYIDHEYVKVLVPSTYTAFKIQQSRWAYGSIQALRKGLKRILNAPNIGLMDKVDLAIYGLQYLPTVISILTLIIYPVILIAISTDLIRSSIDPMIPILPAFTSWIIISILYIINYLRITLYRENSKNIFKIIKRIGTASAVSLASSLEVSINFILGMLSDKYRYIVTPKGVKEGSLSIEKVIRSVLLELTALTILITGIYLSITLEYRITALWLSMNTASLLYTVLIHIASLRFNIYYHR